MRGKTVVVVPTGTANLASVLAGLERAGGRPVVAREYADISEAPRLVLPGVGSFGAAVSKLRSSGAWNAIARYLNKGRPTLAICLGLQLLCTGSEESPGIEGFGFFDAHVGRFPRGLRVPHMGWNTVEPDG
ncbi:MAG: imidazole glycerol phosphate synthase subunit HisH, partial [Deltaproteobacteria bacterium]